MIRRRLPLRWERGSSPHSPLLRRGARHGRWTFVAALLVITFALEPPAAQVGAGSWVELAPLSAARQETGVAELGGKVYVVGGFTGSGATSNVVEVYDPAADRWTTVAPLPAAVHHPAAASMGGQLYVLGGFNAAWVAVDSVFEYSPAEDRWTRRAPLPIARGALAAAALDGKIYAVGGSPVARERDFAAYDPATDRWTALASMPTGRNHLGAAALAGRVYAVGGRAGDGIAGIRNALEEYDPATARWTSRSPLPTPRGGIAAAAVRGCLYVFGGEGNTRSPTGVFGEAEVYDPAVDRWESLEAMPRPRHGLGGAAVGGRVHLPGGATVQGFGATAVHDALDTSGSCDSAARPTPTPTASSGAGGRGFSLRMSGPGAATPMMAWRPGTSQTGYALVRVSPGGATLLPPGGMLLPPGATAYADTSRLADGTHCYLLLPLGATGPLGRSDLLCGVLGSAAGLAATGFAVQLNESNIASLTWGPIECRPLGSACIAIAVDSYVLVVLGGRGGVVGPLPATAIGTTHDTGGLPTCYILVSQAGGTARVGTSDVVCALPGVASL